MRAKKAKLIRKVANKIILNNGEKRYISEALSSNPNNKNETIMHAPGTYHWACKNVKKDFKEGAKL